MNRGRDGLNCDIIRVVKESGQCFRYSTQIAQLTAYGNRKA